MSQAHTFIILFICVAPFHHFPRRVAPSHHPFAVLLSCRRDRVVLASAKKDTLNSYSLLKHGIIIYLEIMDIVLIKVNFSSEITTIM